MRDIATEKFWIIGDFERYLLHHGMSGRAADLLSFFLTLILIFIIIVIFDYIFNKISVRAIHKAAAKTVNKWDDYLVERHFFRRAIRFFMSIILVYVIEFFLQGYDVRIIKVSVVIMELIAVFYLLLMLFAILDTCYDIYQTLPRAKEKSIKGYIQTIKIVFVIIAIILAMVIIFKVSFGKFFTGIAASAAIVTLVFKDVILGFIASIQLSAQDTVRLGDWIEMPSKKANGTVVELNVTTVKVQNWDMTYSMIPIYSMVSDAFINWRGMQEGSGRRFLRQFYIDINTIKPVSVDTIDRLRSNV
ncbi:MAG: mechanosensitive ion channel, partial [Rikenellaceae bacterium]